MPERLQIGHQLHVVTPGVGIQLQDILAVERAAPLANTRMMRKHKGVLGVELENVRLVEAELIHQQLECLQCGHLAARDIQHQTAVTQRRPVADVHCGPLMAFDPRDLTQSLHCQVESQRALPASQDSLRRNVHKVCLLPVAGHFLVPAQMTVKKGLCGLIVGDQQYDIVDARGSSGLDDGQAQTRCLQDLLSKAARC